ncbi:hypothetical protein ACOMHN_031708 [Nucella lapillus]
MDKRKRRCRWLFAWLTFFTFLPHISAQPDADLCKPELGYEQFKGINENTEIGTVILSLNTLGSSSAVNLTMENNANFAFNASSQEVSVSGQLDADIPTDTNLYTLVIVCKEANKQPVDISVLVTIKDINDNAPQFEKDHFYVNVSETMNVDQSFDSKVKATDADKSFTNNAIYYSVQEGTYSNYFQFPNALSPFLVLKQTLDFETLPTLTITVVAANQLSRGDKLNSTALLTVRVTDEDDLNPVFSSPLYEGTILENAQMNSLVNVTPVIHAVDADVTLNESITYSFHDQIFLCDRDSHSSQKVFTINNQTGEVRVVGPISPSKVSVVVQATQTNNPSRYGVAMLVITVMGVNSNAPQFQSELYQTFVSEAVPAGTTLLFVSATDQDFGASIQYGIVGDDPRFVIDANSGWISLKSPLDFETAQFHSFTIKAFDGNMESTARVEVHVVDADDNAPVIPDQPLSFNVERDNKNVITQIQATDADAATKLSFRLANHINLFSIDASGNFRISAEAAELPGSEYNVVIIVSDNATASHEKVALLALNFPPLTTTPAAVTSAAATTPSSETKTTTEKKTTATTTALPVVMSGPSDDTLAIALGVVAAVLLVVVVVLVIFICRRRGQTSEHLDKAKANRSPDPRGLKFKNAPRGSRLDHLHFHGEDSLDGTTTIQENPLSFKDGAGVGGGAFNHAFVYPDHRENDHHMDEIHIETAVIPYQASDTYNNNNNRTHHGASSPSDLFQHDDSSEYGDSLPSHKRSLMYPDNTSSESLNTSHTNSSADGGTKQLLIGNGVTSFGTTSFGKNAAEGGGGGGGGVLDPTLPVVAVEGLNPDVSVAPQEQKSELTVYF